MATAVGPNIVEDGLVLSVDAGSERSYPRNNLDVSWLDYSSGLANGRYSILNSTQPYDILIKNNYASWIGSFSHDILSAENYTIMFDYVADASSSLVLDNDGVNDNNWNATIPVTTSVQTYNVTKAVTATGNIKFYTRRASGGNITISNFRFFKADTVDSLVGTNTGTLTNGAGFSNDNGGVFTFDGSNDFISFNSTLTFSSSNLSSVAWVKLDDYSSPQNPSIGFSPDSGSSGFRIYATSATGLGVWTRTGSGAGTSSINTSNGIPLNEWVQITFVLNGTNGKLYKNGTEVLSGTFTQPSVLSSAPVWISRYSGGGYYVDGESTACMLYNRALTAAEVTQNYNAQKNRFL